MLKEISGIDFSGAIGIIRLSAGGCLYILWPPDERERAMDFLFKRMAVRSRGFKPAARLAAVFAAPLCLAWALPALASPGESNAAFFAAAAGMKIAAASPQTAASRRQMAVRRADKLPPKRWIKPPQASFSGFQAHVQALGPPNISYGESALQKARERAAAFPLKEKIIQAQELYLSGAAAGAQKIFGEISALAHSADWSSGQRRIIFYSFLRRAQGESGPGKRKSLLLSAGSLALWDFRPGGAFGPEDPDRELFPPPLLRELDELRSRQPSLSVDWKKIFPHHEIILLNGKRLDKGRKSQIPEGVYRASAFSSSHEPWSKALSLSQLLSHSIKAEPLTKGYCGSLRLRQKFAAENVFLFPPSDCEKDLAFSKARQEKLLKSRPPPLKEAEAAGQKAAQAEDSKKWLWAAGAGLAALVVLFAALSDGPPEEPPSKRTFHY